MANNKDAVFKILKNEVKKFLGKDSGGHDYYHSERVFNNALTLRESEGGDELVIGCAALVHDICRPWEKETGKSHFGGEALEIIRTLLKKVDIDSKVIQQILDVVREHDIYNWTGGNKSKPLEVQIIQDADRLDAIGAIGIARVFAFGGGHDRLMWEPQENLDFTSNFVDSPSHKSSSIAHFYEKLLKLKDSMNTATGLKLAQGRHEYMEKFLDQFFAEWKGEA